LTCGVISGSDALRAIGIIRFENQDKFKTQYPADYICEAVDQTRGWFYSCSLSTLLMDSVSYKKSLPGFDLDESGRKMSKSLGNIVNAVGCAQG